MKGIGPTGTIPVGLTFYPFQRVSKVASGGNNRMPYLLVAPVVMMLDVLLVDRVLE